MGAGGYEQQEKDRAISDTVICPIHSVFLSACANINTVCY